MNKLIRIIVNGLVKIFTNCMCNCACIGCKSSCVSTNNDNDSEN